MTQERYKEIKAIHDEKETLSKWRHMLSHIISVRYYLGRVDGEDDGTMDIPITKDFSKEIINLIDDRISRLEKQFAEL